MKKIGKIVIAVAMLFLANVSLAQKDKKHGDHKRHSKNEHKNEGKALEKMTKELELTPQQQTDLMPILKEMKAKAESFKNTEDKKAMRMEMKEFREKKQEQIKAILTESQFEKYEKMNEENKRKMKEKREGKN